MMMNYVMDFNNNIAVIVKKSYLRNAQKGNTWEALEVADMKKNGLTIKNGTGYKVDYVRTIVWKNHYWARALSGI